MEEPPQPILGLLHPSGAAARWLVIGDGEGLGARPEVEDAETASTPDADLVALCPSPRQARDRRWLLGAAQKAASVLATDGVGYVAAPPGARLTLLRALSRAGVSSPEPFIHIQQAGVAHFLVPLAASHLRFAGTRLLDSRRAKLLAGEALRMRGSRAGAVAFLPGVGVGVRRHGASPLATWADVDPQLGLPVVAAGWNSRSSRVAIWPGPTGDAAAIFKVSCSVRGDLDLQQEAEALATLGDDARMAGASVPRVLDARVLGERLALRLEPLAGSVAARALREGRLAVDVLTGRLSSWLRRWAERTVTRRAPTRQQLEVEILDPARRLADLVPDSGAYLDLLRDRCQRALQASLPLVADHGDLTAWNILVTPQGEIGVVDWRGARAEALPLADLAYALVVMREGGASVARSALSAGADRKRVDDLADAVGVPPEHRPLCLDACWLRHALDERERSDAEDAGFVATLKEHVRMTLEEHRTGRR